MFCHVTLVTGVFSFNKRIFPLIVFVIFASFFFSFAKPVSAATITVNVNADISLGSNGACSLREAIANANADSDTTGGDCAAGSGTDTIVFSGAMTITTLTPLPIITSPIHFDGISGGNGTCSTKGLGIIISGDGFNFDTTSDGSSVRGFVIKDYFNSGVSISGSDFTISCSMIGLDETGTSGAVAFGANPYGVVIGAGVDNITIGGTGVGDGNIISGNTGSNYGVGISIGIDATNVVIQGNYIGTDKTGMVAVTNINGISIQGSSGPSTASITIGGTNAGEGNVISGNTGDALGIYNMDGGLTFQGNYVGVAADGNTPLGNNIGLRLADSSNLTIGGNTEGARNIFGETINERIHLTSDSNVSIIGNYLGVGIDGITTSTTVNANISIETSDSVTIGGSSLGSGNVLVNSGRGITVWSASTDIVIKGNYIGVLPDGETAAPNDIGVDFVNVTGATIGGSGTYERNIISGNGTGISLGDTTTVTIINNYIGVGASGNTAVPNDNAGITLTNSGSIAIGGGSSAERNIISGNTGDGIVYGTGSNNLIISGNYIGVGADGVTSLGNSFNGISSTDGDSIIIGGTTLGQGNTVVNSGGAGIRLENQTGLDVFGNYLGLLPDGITAAGNTDEAIEVKGGSDITIGGPTIAKRNVVSANRKGITVNDGVTNVTIQGNYVGVAADGVTPMPNAEVAMPLADMTTALIGGVVEGEGNIVGGSNSGDDVVTINGSSNVQVFGNNIGVGSDGITALPSAGMGIILFSSADTAVGGIGAGEKNTIKNNSIGVGIVADSGAGITIIGNTIADNTSYGVLIFKTSAVPGTPMGSIMQNSITNNEALGIELFEDIDSDFYPDSHIGEDVNDAGDADIGPNDFLNHPVLTTINYETDTVTYSLDVPSGYYHVEFFKNPTYGLSPSGYGEGEIFVGADDGVYSTGSALTGRTYVISGGIASTDVITATATECTDATCTAFLATSEFSDSETPSVTVVSSGGGGGDGGMINIVSPLVCKDPKALNYEAVGTDNPKLCKYAAVMIVIPSSNKSVLGSGACSVHLRLSDTLRQGDKDGYYSSRTKKKATQVALLQSHINRILALQYNQAAGPTDGKFGPKTKEGVKRLQTVFNQVLKPISLLEIDGIVGAFTRDAINNSCGGMR